MILLRNLNQKETYNIFNLQANYHRQSSNLSQMRIMLRTDLNKSRRRSLNLNLMKMITKTAVSNLMSANHNQKEISNISNQHLNLIRKESKIQIKNRQSSKLNRNQRKWKNRKNHYLPPERTLQMRLLTIMTI